MLVLVVSPAFIVILLNSVTKLKYTTNQRSIGYVYTQRVCVLYKLINMIEIYLRV